MWRCDEVSFVLGNATALQKSYPQCAQAGSNITHVHIAIHASLKEGKLGSGSCVRAIWGMCMWVAIVLHILGVETYVRAMGTLHLLEAYTPHG
jgi:hypothetical protein